MLKPGTKSERPPDRAPAGRKRSLERLRLEANPCKTCGAAAGESCRNRDGLALTLNDLHLDRKKSLDEQHKKEDDH